MPRATKNGMLDWLTEPKEVYHRSVVKERKERAAAKKAEDRAQAAWDRKVKAAEAAVQKRQREVEKQDKAEAKRQERAHQHKLRVLEQREAAAERREAAKQEAKRKAEMKPVMHRGVRIYPSDGGFKLSSVDRESVFDSKEDAKAFIDDQRRTNPMGQPNITDRGLRYRANRNAPEGPRQCNLCGSKQNVEVGHVDGHEENSEPFNLFWTCRSCNVLSGNTLRKAGLGRLTKQYNPAGGAKTLGQWMNAIASMKGIPGGDMSVADAVHMIHQTSAGKRSEFANQIWRVRGGRKKASDEPDWVKNPARWKNPEDAAAALSEAFHGRPAKKATTYVDKIHVHQTLADLGQAVRLCVLDNEGKKRDILFDGKTRLASNEEGDQYFFVDGDQSIDPADFGVERSKETVVLGKAFGITYLTTKHHLGNEGGTADYEHTLGDERLPLKQRDLPTVVYNTRNQEIELKGGSYHIDVDIDGQYSAGIRD